MCAPQHKAAAQTCLVNAENEAQDQNDSKAVNWEWFSHLARNRAVWESNGDDRVLGSELNLFSR